MKGHLSVSGFLSGIENGIQVGFRLVPFLPVLVAVLLGSASLAIAQTETVVYSFPTAEWFYMRKAIFTAQRMRAELQRIVQVGVERCLK